MVLGMILSLLYQYNFPKTSILLVCLLLCRVKLVILINVESLRSGILDLLPRLLPKARFHCQPHHCETSSRCHSQLLIAEELKQHELRRLWKPKLQHSVRIVVLWDYATSAMRDGTKTTSALRRFNYKPSNSCGNYFNQRMRVLNLLSFQKHLGISSSSPSLSLH